MLKNPAYHLKKILLLCCMFTCLLAFNFSCKKKEKELVRITITKLRTREDLAKKLSGLMGEDIRVYTQFLNSNDSLQIFQRDTNTIMAAIIPNTYFVYKGAEIQKVLKKILDYNQVFWTPERIAKAKKLGLTPDQVVVMASIVEEETNAPADKGKIASVYLNRLKKDMRLEADPTLKFAIKDFALERVIDKHKEMAASSPYSTYANKGLPPGPICTPAIQTIDAVLNAPETNYIFFVAKPDYSGLSNFTENYQVHLQNARTYQRFLDSIGVKKKLTSKSTTK